MDRKFGVEMEVVGIAAGMAERAISAVGVDIACETYNHTTRSYWKIVPDGSVRNGFEVVSPVLYGDEGLEQARRVAQALDDAGATVNRSCGLHVHFDAADLDVAAIRSIVRRYGDFEGEIDAFMPESRRGDANTYCKSVRQIMAQRAFSAARTVAELADAQHCRYFKVNLQSLQRHGTLEFRQHSGTVNAAKVCNWIAFLAEFIDESVRLSRQDAAAPAPVVGHLGLRGVQGALAGMFTATRTVTIAAMCERFGWQAHSARAAVTYLRRAGLEIAAVRVDGAAAYELRSGLASAPRAQAADSLFSGIASSIVTFYRNRAAVLAL